MTEAKTKRRFFLAINGYRNSTSDGFADTWVVCECRNQAHQRAILRDGLPVNDQWHLTEDGRRLPYYSKNGIRIATPSEIRTAKREEPWNPILPLAVQND